MRIRKRIFPWAAVVGFFVVFGVISSTTLAKERFEEKLEKTVALSRDGKVILGNISGDIEIKTWDRAEVQVNALKVSRTDSEKQAKENFAHVEITIEKDNGTLRIETKYAKNWFRGSKRNCSVQYWLTIPDRADITAHSVSGDVTVSDIGGAGRAETVSGDVRMTDITGYAKGKSVSGNVNMLRAENGFDGNSVSGDVEVSSVTGDVDLGSVSGDIIVTGVTGDIEAETVSGDVDLTGVSGAQTVKASTLSGSVEYSGKIVESGTYRLKSHSGSVTMTIPADSAFDVVAKTFSGRVSSDFDITVSGKLSRKEIRGTVNGGGADIELKSFSGSINLDKR